MTEQTKLERIAECEENIQEYESLVDGIKEDIIDTQSEIDNLNHDEHTSSDDQLAQLNSEKQELLIETKYWRKELELAQAMPDETQVTEQTKSERIAECEENIQAIRDEIDSLESELNTANQNLDDYGQYAVAHETSEIKAIIKELRTDIQEQKSDLAKWESELELAQAMSDDELQVTEQPKFEMDFQSPNDTIKTLPLIAFAGAQNPEFAKLIHDLYMAPYSKANAEQAIPDDEPQS